VIDSSVNTRPELDVAKLGTIALAILWIIDRAPMASDSLLDLGNASKGSLE